MSSELSIGSVIGDPYFPHFVEQFNHIDVGTDAKSLQVHIIGLQHHVYVL